jgi:putative ABC transport system ATP-binding protein
VYTLNGVTKNYQKGGSKVEALRGVDVVIEDGEWLAIQGPTGHGKSSNGSRSRGLWSRNPGCC